MKKQIVPTDKIPFITLLALIEAVDTLRDELEDLKRGLRGAISVKSKNNIATLISEFKNSVKNLPCDDMLDLTIRNMILISEIIKSAPSTDGIGYTTIEKNVANLFYQIGFIKGYLYVLYETCRGNKLLTFEKGPDKDDDEANNEYSVALVKTETHLAKLKI